MWKALRIIYNDRIRRIKGKGSVKTRQMVAQLLKENSHDYDVIGGHVRFGIGENCVDRDYYYFTLLRDPTRVLLSRYYKQLDPRTQMRKAKNRPGEFEENLKELKNKMDKPPEEFLQYRNNPLIRYLGGNYLEDNSKVGKEHLELAKERLQNDYICFGLVERYSESIELIAKTLGWKKIPSMERRNTGTNRPSGYAPKLLELGRKTNALDYELYYFAEQLFCERLEKLRSGG